VSRDEAAEILADTLNRVGSVDPLFASWRDLGWTKRSASTSAALDQSPESIAPRLKQNRTEVDRKVIPELGFSISAWNGAKGDDNQAGFSAHIGSYAGTPGIRNSLVLNLPSSWPPGDPRVGQIAEAFVTSAQPDEVVLFVDDLRTVLWTANA
jgi:hypothetical protein